MKKPKTRAVYKRTYRYLILLCATSGTLSSKESTAQARRSTAQHRTAGQNAWHGTAPHGTARRRAAEL